MKTVKKKLVLARETLRALADAELKTVAGLEEAVRTIPCYTVPREEWAPD